MKHSWPVCRTVAQWGFRGVRVGEAANPGCRERCCSRHGTVTQSQRTSGMPRLEPENGEQVLPPPVSRPPSEVFRALEADSCGTPRASRRVALGPQSPRATQDSVVCARTLKGFR